MSLKFTCSMIVYTWCALLLHIIRTDVAGWVCSTEKKTLVTCMLPCTTVIHTYNCLVSPCRLDSNLKSVKTLPYCSTDMAPFNNSSVKICDFTVRLITML